MWSYGIARGAVLCPQVGPDACAALLEAANAPGPDDAAAAAALVQRCEPVAAALGVLAFVLLKAAARSQPCLVRPPRPQVRTAD